MCEFLDQFNWWLIGSVVASFAFGFAAGILVDDVDEEASYNWLDRLPSSWREK